MSNRKLRGRAVASAAVVAAAVGVAGFAFTASNTVPDTKAGDGSGTITGFVVSSVHYTLNGTDPDLADAVSFTLDSAPVAGSTLRAQLVRQRCVVHVHQHRHGGHVRHDVAAGDRRLRRQPPGRRRPVVVRWSWGGIVDPTPSIRRSGRDL